MKFSPAQRDILARLDGAAGPVEFDGTRKRSLDFLKDKGMLTYRKVSRDASTYYFPRYQTFYLAVLTQEGSDFIYNGGIDH